MISPNEICNSDELPRTLLSSWKHFFAIRRSIKPFREIIIFLRIEKFLPKNSILSRSDNYCVSLCKQIPKPKTLTYLSSSPMRKLPDNGPHQLPVLIVYKSFPGTNSGFLSPTTPTIIPDVVPDLQRNPTSSVDTHSITKTSLHTMFLRLCINNLTQASSEGPLYRCICQAKSFDMLYTNNVSQTQTTEARLTHQTFPDIIG